MVASRVTSAQAVRAELPYPIYVARGLLQSLHELVEAYAPNYRYVFIVDANLASVHAPLIGAEFPADRTLRLIAASGEREKTRAQWEQLSDAILSWGAGRDTTVIAVGGGVTGDLAGFVAATLHRGVPVVQVPSTLLAMVDSAVGGKTGVDTVAGKNLIGAFHNPSLVIADVDLLQTLPHSVRADGLAEMIKHGLIADAELFTELCGWLPELASSAGAESPQLPALIASSVGVKANVVARDAREAGRRHILNAGHTIAHAIEHATEYRVSHGQAVAAGLVVETRLAEQLGLAEPGLGDLVASAVLRAGLPDGVPESVSDDALLSATRTDKKARGGQVRYSLATRIGRMAAGPDGRWSVPVEDAAVLTALSASRRHAKQPATCATLVG